MNHINKIHAAYKLFDEISDIWLKVEKASLLIGDLTVDYFRVHPGQINEMSEDDRALVCAGYSRYGITAEIVCDYIYSIRKDIEALDNLCRAGMAIARAERENAG